MQKKIKSIYLVKKQKSIVLDLEMIVVVVIGVVVVVVAVMVVMEVVKE